MLLQALISVANPCMHQLALFHKIVCVAAGLALFRSVFLIRSVQGGAKMQQDRRAVQYQLFDHLLHAFFLLTLQSTDLAGFAIAMISNLTTGLEKG